MDKSHKIFSLARSTSPSRPSDISLAHHHNRFHDRDSADSFFSPEIRENLPAPLSPPPRTTQRTTRFHATSLALRCSSADTRTPPRCGVPGGHPHRPPTDTRPPHLRPHPQVKDCMPLANTCVCIILRASSVAFRIKSIRHHTELPKAHHVRGWALIPPARRSSHPAPPSPSQSSRLDVRPAYSSCLGLSGTTGNREFIRGRLKWSRRSSFPLRPSFRPPSLPPSLPAPSSPEQVLATVVGHQSSPPDDRGKKPIIGCDPTTQGS